MTGGQRALVMAFAKIESAMRDLKDARMDIADGGAELETVGTKFVVDRCHRIEGELADLLVRIDTGLT